MKKLVYLIIVIVALGLIVSGCIPVVPPAEKDEATILTKRPNDKPPPGEHYNLNIIGKKWDWDGKGSYDNESRHTMFVPEDIVEYNNKADTTCFAPDPRGEEDEPVGAGITIWMTQCPEGVGCDFAVLDGNAFNDCKCEFRLAPGKYEVWIVAKAKPAKKDDPEYYTNITGWVRYYDDGVEYVACDLGTLNVKKKLGWQDATNLFYFGGEWVFDYLKLLEAEYEDPAYFWQYDNHGNKLVKVRFYKVK